MAKSKKLNISELVNEYDENFINSISLANVTNNKELKDLLANLDKANSVITAYYETLYNDYIMMINSDHIDPVKGIDLTTLKRYKSLATRIQKAYNYILYITTFENPFKPTK